MMRNCSVLFGSLRFINIFYARVGAMWTDGIENPEVEVECAS